MTCEHRHVGLFYDLKTLSRYEGGPIEIWALEGNARCGDCGMWFRDFRIKLEPKSAETPLILPSDEELRRIGRVTEH